MFSTVVERSASRRTLYHAIGTMCTEPAFLADEAAPDRRPGAILRQGVEPPGHWMLLVT
jgi:hypothetical protein